MEAAVMTNAMVVQDCYGYFSTGNIPALLEKLTDDVQWFTPGPKEVMPWVGKRTGKAQVGEFFSLLNQHVEFLKFEPKEYIEQGNKVVALGHMEGKSRNTGKISSTDWAMVFTLKNGKVTNFQEYSDTYEGFKAFS